MEASVKAFCDTVWDYYAHNARHLPWREPEKEGIFDPYKILVSEIMLQQTQASRVVDKYQEFIKIFPSVMALAAAPLSSVLQVWVGLGYNRRAKYLADAAKIISQKYNGQVPRDLEALVGLPGVGHNTAVAVMVYAFNEPLAFIETNIRTVYIHHFFKHAQAVADKELLPLVAQTVDQEHPREWYWALMDYGTYLKKVSGNSSRRSKHNVRQSQFSGSKRQLRGQVIRLLTEKHLTLAELSKIISNERLNEVLGDLVQERLIRYTNGVYSLSQE